MKKFFNPVCKNCNWYFVFILVISFSFHLRAQEIDSLWAVWNNKQQPDTCRMEAMKEISWKTLFINPDSGYVLAETLLNFAVQKNDFVMQATALKTMGLSVYFKDDFQKALELYNQALQRAKQVDASLAMSKIYNNIGVTQKALGNYDLALEAHLNSLAIKEELNDRKGMAISYNNMGVIYSTQENLPMAIDYFHKNLKIAEELNLTYRIASANQNIGLIYLRQKNFTRALSYFLSSEVSFKEMNHTRGLCTVYNNIGVVYKEMGELDVAVDYYESALKLGTEIDDKTTISNVYRNLGNIYSLQGNFTMAMDYFQKNLEIKKEMGDKNHMIAALIDIGSLYLELDEPMKAEQWCKKAYVQASEFNYLEEIVNSCKCLKTAYHELGNIKKAYKFQNEYYTSRDSLDKLENKGEVTRMVMNYEFEKQRLADSLAMVEERLNTKLAYQENLNKEKNRQRTFLFAGIAILFIAGALYSRLLFVRRNNKRLEEKNKIIEYEKQRAEESERSKEHFFSNVSHEFRTPLTLIKGPLENIISKTTDIDLKNELGIIQRNANRLYSMINELLNLYKLESGKIRLYARKIEIVDFVNRLVQSFESMVIEKNIKLVFTSKYDNCYVYADEEKLEKILNNFLSNAFKFTDKGGQVIVDLTPHAPLKGGNTPALQKGAGGIQPAAIEITVTDTGIGIPDDKLANVFDRFYQVNDIDKRGYEGTGIGLALTKELVELHHGTIWVKSKLGEGSSFTFTIPKGKEHLKPDEINPEEEGGHVVDTFDSNLTEIEEQPVKSEQTEKKKGLPILLIVEDNADMRIYIRSCFDENQYSIEEAKDGEQGLNQAIETVPDLIISDVMMPKMDGNEMCTRIKTDERTSHIPVVLVTARASIEQKIEGIETGADVYLPKPFNAQELQVWVKKLIEQRKKLRESFMRRFDPGFDFATEDIPGVDQQFIQKALGIVDEYISDSEFSVEKFGREMAMSRVQLHRKLKALTDQSTSEFVRTIRLKKAASYLRTNGAKVSEAAYNYGFNNHSYFSKCFANEYGMTPTEYINSNKQ